MLSYGADVENMAGIGLGDVNSAAQTGVQLGTSHLTPMAAAGVGILLTSKEQPAVPEPYNDQLWDKNAPSPAAMAMQAVSKMADRFAPSTIRGAFNAAAEKDPKLLVGVFGPNIYTAPNSGPQTRKSFAVMEQLRARLSKTTDPTAKAQLYDLIQRLSQDDPGALREAQQEQKVFERATKHRRAAY
jgi:hypothetical protein